MATPMVLGFAITRHCNLRCPHCIRDDVVSVQELAPEFIHRVTDEAVGLWGNVVVSLTGGEPLIHRRFTDLIEGIAERGIPYRFVSNGWHLGRVAKLLARHPATVVRLSLSGGDETVHDEERGRGSFRRVLMGVGILRHLGIPAALSLVIDRRSRHQIRQTVDLAEQLGCQGLHFILPQPVPASLIRGTDLDPGEWWDVAREVRTIAAEPGRLCYVQLDYGAPTEGPEPLCDTFTHKRVYVDADGQLSTCCQLSEYGGGSADVVADLHQMSLTDAWPLYVTKLRAQQCASARPASGGDMFDALPCIRCARATGKMDWITLHEGESPWMNAGLARVS